MDALNGQTKILFLSADPVNLEPLRLAQERRDIETELRGTQFLLKDRGAARSGDIIRAILEVEPQIVHFSGHGLSTGELCCENSLGQAHPLSPDAIANLFRLVARHVECVILNACYSEVQAKAIAEHIPYVIGMSQAVGDKAAIEFAIGFYRALGLGRSFQEAYEFACVGIQLGEGKKLVEHLIPVLYFKNTFFKKLVLEERVSDTPSNSSCSYSFLPLPFIFPDGLEIDFKHLDNLLTAQKWKDADAETQRLIFKVSRKKHLFQVNTAVISSLPCAVLQTIDELWRRSSQGQFSFSTQKEVYGECIGKMGVLNYDLLGRSLGWKEEGNWNIHVYSANPFCRGHFPKPLRLFNRANTLRGCFIPPLLPSFGASICLTFLGQPIVISILIGAIGFFIALLSFIIHTSSYLKGLEWITSLLAKLEICEECSLSSPTHRSSYK